MKTFAGTKDIATIRAQCKAQGLTLNDRMYRKHGWDTVVVSGGGCAVYFHTFNGRFYGKTPNGVSFDSSETKHERKPWFQALLAFFYVEKDEVAA